MVLYILYNIYIYIIYNIYVYIYIYIYIQNQYCKRYTILCSRHQRFLDKIKSC